MTDASNKPIALTQNIEVYNLFVDPKFIWDKPKVIDILTPIIYTHLCEKNGLEDVNTLGCIQNIERFAQIQILPTPKVVFYTQEELGDNYWSATGISLMQQEIIEENSTIDLERQQIMSAFSGDQAINIIKSTLDNKISIGIKEKNYLWYFENNWFLDELSWMNLPYVEIQNRHYVYVVPNRVPNIVSAREELHQVLKKFWYAYSDQQITNLFVQQENRYVKLADGLNAILAKKVNDLINDNYTIKSTCEGRWDSCIKGIPLLHWVWLEKNETRYYPYSKFAANIIWFYAKEGYPLYGVEQYFDSLLKGTPGEIRWLSTPLLGQIGSNEVAITQPVDGRDIYLSIDPMIQKKLEQLAEYYTKSFNADSIAAIVMNPYDGKIISSVNYPTFDPNNYQDAYKLKPLSLTESVFVDDDTYRDIPVFYLSWEKVLPTTYEQRKDPTIPKYISTNKLGAQVFIDKNIAQAYEPGSIIKPFTAAIGIDSDEISLYDYYDDPNKVEIDIGNGLVQVIGNADKKNCWGIHPMLHAVIFSCNIGMVRIGQKIGKEVFYNYMDKFGFGKPTWLELAGERPGRIEWPNNIPISQFYNNTFGQGMLATPVQIAAGYSILVNGGHVVKPTLIDKIYDPETQQFIENQPKIGAQVIKPETSAKLRDTLFQVVYAGLTKQYGIPGYTLGGKTGTSQLAFQGRYMNGPGWTDWSFVGMVTKDDLKYIVVIQVHRPRTSQYGEYTAGKLFGDLAKFLIEKGLITK